MSPEEAAQIVAEAATLGIGIQPVDADHLADMASGWTEVCEDVPYDFAHRMLIQWESPYNIRASQVRGRWNEERRNGEITYDERACDWARLCNCPHTIGVCDRGFIDEPREEVERIVGETRHGTPIIHRSFRSRHCPRCWEAKMLRRQELGKDPVPLGTIGPGR